MKHPVATPVQHEHERRALEMPEHPGEALLSCLGHPDVASKEWIVRQYDHEVQGASVVKPFVGTQADGPSDAAVIRPLDSTDAGCALETRLCMVVLGTSVFSCKPVSFVGRRK